MAPENETGLTLNIGVGEILESKCVVYEANIQPPIVTVGQVFTVTAITSQGVSRVIPLNDKLGGVASTLVGYEDVDGKRIWTLTMSVGTSGMRMFSFGCTDRDGNLQAETVQCSIRVNK